MVWVNRLVLKGLEFVRENQQMGNRKLRQAFARLDCFTLLTFKLLFYQTVKLTRSFTSKHVLRFNIIKQLFTFSPPKGDLQLRYLLRLRNDCNFSKNYLCEKKILFSSQYYKISFYLKNILKS